MNIVYLVFGTKIENYQQAYFSIFTALLHKNDDDKIIVITDLLLKYDFSKYIAGKISISKNPFLFVSL